MSKAFKAIRAPKNFRVTLYENPDFITIEIDPHELIALTEKQQIKAVEYVNKVKKTLEGFGAVILVVRKEINGTDN